MGCPGFTSIAPNDGLEAIALRVEAIALKVGGHRS